MIASSEEGIHFRKLLTLGLLPNPPHVHGQCIHVLNINMHKQFLFMGEKLGCYVRDFSRLLKMNDHVYFRHH